MEKVARFEKVSFEQFKKDWLKNCPINKSAWTNDEIKEIYNNIKLPGRGTKGSAGYDFYVPVEINIPFNTSKTIPTGIRCNIKEGWFLNLNPRSGQGFKYGIRLANTRGIIDSDYYGADNEGHIMVKIVNNEDAVNHDKNTFTIEKDKAFCQGIFTIYGITEDDDADDERTGGFGSTNR